MVGNIFLDLTRNTIIYIVTTLWQKWMYPRVAFMEKIIKGQVKSRKLLRTTPVDREKNFMKNDSYLDPLRQQLWALEQNG